MACWINGCTTKGGKKETFTKKSLFTARTEKMLQCWRDNGIAARGINEFSKKSRICELHFEKDDILREDIFHMTDGATITVQRKIPKLKEDAVPSIFPSGISYCRLNRINEEKPKEQQNGETSITAQLKSTVNCSVSVPAECESDNPGWPGKVGRTPSQLGATNRDIRDHFFYSRAMKFDLLTSYFVISTSTR